MRNIEPLDQDALKAFYGRADTSHNAKFKHIVGPHVEYLLTDTFSGQHVFQMMSDLLRLTVQDGWTLTSHVVRDHSLSCVFTRPAGTPNAEIATRVGYFKA